MSFTFRAILDWLRAGYPHGIPREDYIALLGVLQRHLTEQEIVEVVDHLQRQRGLEPVSTAQIREAIENLLKGQATEEDVQRVTAKLATAGWPTTQGGSSPTADEDGTEKPEVEPSAGPGVPQIGVEPLNQYSSAPERRTA
ncbi:DUF3349 domain-containing protein [Austwickia chelonae]|uniref:DUF3349 domain-containing protein n=1 Tax=Austwickia chelonae TaxID=100225 RepID=UPI000E240A1B|nr:DUF3349 domain-containing protein [Austwickia chelonae]